MRVRLVTTVERDLVLGCQPQLRIRRVFLERHDCAADASDERMHHRPKQRTTIEPGGGAECEPAEYLGLTDRTPDFFV